MANSRFPLSVARQRAYSSDGSFILLLFVVVILRMTWGFSPLYSENPRYHGGESWKKFSLARRTRSRLWVGDARGDYYGESSGSYMVKEFNTYEQLEEIVKLAAQPLPERPDGICLVAKFTTAGSADARATEAEYERVARKNPATIFLRCFAEYENADVLLGQANVAVWPTFDLFYRGNRVARVEGPNYAEVEDLLERYQFQNSNLDLFSEAAVEPWGDGKAKADFSKTPRTTARFIPGYDWNTDKGFFDATADKAASDFEQQFGNWLPNTEDE